MNPLSALSYPFRSKNWLSVMFAQSLAAIVIIIGWFAMFGYSIRVAGEVANGFDDEMPNWNFGENMRVGFLALIGYFLYLIPMFFVVSLLSGGGGTSSSNSSGAALIFLIAFVFATAYGGLVMIALVRYAATDEFSSFFQIGANVSLFVENIMPVIVASFSVVLGYVLLFVFLSVSSFLICVPLLSLGYFSIYTGHIIGQLGANLKISPDEYRKDEPGTDKFR